MYPGRREDATCCALAEVGRALPLEALRAVLTGQSQALRDVRLACNNKKQCSRQLQCEVPCGVSDVVNSSLLMVA